ncbi:nucleotidyltransferase family protein [Paradesulfitobacterium ferrireducens]|uniref:nucleotidyltransferase family protein n=1 Tax=Paradesulfitobacterium ferrireducens TaxID=2816476 RepID=UPI001A8FF988|nr:nucleotidyltransferase domain-containing protein [Paradesulfitobacterium ferrireducens]
MSFGLLNEDLSYIIKSLQQFPEIKKAAIFGSRAKGTYKSGSDVDIAIWGDSITFSTVSRLHAMLEEESPMPYFFDIVDYSHLNHDELRKHIDRVGVPIFVKGDRVTAK